LLEVEVVASRLSRVSPAGLAGAGMLVLSTALSPVTARAGEVSRLFIFGDSSADVGADGARYTNDGPMWAESLARRLGRDSTPARGITLDGDGRVDRDVPPVKRTGTNYAVGGATAAPWPGRIHFADQLGWFREDHPDGFGRHDLALLWMGSNDAAEAILAGVEYDPERYADAYMAHVEALRDLGARSIVAINEPERLLPRRYYQDVFGLEEEDAVALMAAQGEAIAASNTALADRLPAADVYVLDLNRLADAILADPARFGFTATTDGYMTLGDPRDLPDDGNLFADNHYSVAMHTVVSDFVLAQLAARDRFVRLATAPLDGVRSLQADLAPRLAGVGTWSAPVGAVTLTADATFSRHNRNRQGTDPGQDQQATGVRLTGDWRAADALALGVQAGWRSLDWSVPGTGGGVTGQDLSGTLYAVASPLDGTMVSLAATLGRVDYDTIDRRTTLGATAVGQAKGDTVADYAALRVGLARSVAIDGWTLTPGVAVGWTWVETAGYDEAAGPLSLSYGTAVVTEWRASAGVTLARAAAADGLRPRLSLAWDQALTDRPVSVQVGPAADRRARFESGRGDRSLLRAEAGLSWALTPAVSLDLALSGALPMEGDDRRIRSQARLGLSVGF